MVSDYGSTVEYACPEYTYSFSTKTLSLAVHMMKVDAKRSVAKLEYPPYSVQQKSNIIKLLVNICIFKKSFRGKTVFL